MLSFLQIYIYSHLNPSPAIVHATVSHLPSKFLYHWYSHCERTAIRYLESALHCQCRRTKREEREKSETECRAVQLKRATKQETRNRMPSSKGEPTDPKLREEVKEEVKAEEKGEIVSFSSDAVRTGRSQLRGRYNTSLHLTRYLFPVKCFCCSPVTSQKQILSLDNYQRPSFPLPLTSLSLLHNHSTSSLTLYTKSLQI